MGTRGPKPRSTAEKLVRGNPGRRPLKTLVPAPRRGDVLCPVNVAKNPRAAADLGHVSARVRARPPGPD